MASSSPASQSGTQLFHVCARWVSRNWLRTMERYATRTMPTRAQKMTVITRILPDWRRPDSPSLSPHRWCPRVLILYFQPGGGDEAAFARIAAQSFVIMPVHAAHQPEAFPDNGPGTIGIAGDSHVRARGVNAAGETSTGGDANSEAVVHA